MSKIQENKHTPGFQFKDPDSYMCLAGAVVASWSLAQEVAGSNPFTVMNTPWREIPGSTTTWSRFV